MIPSPNVTNNHQEKNAGAISERGGAVLLLEKDCTPEAIYAKIKEILSNPQMQNQMRTALRGACVLDSAERICDILEELAASKK